MLFDSVQIGAPDLEEAVRHYRILLGREGEDGDGGHRFALERGAVELIAGEAGVRSLRFAPEPGTPPWPSAEHAYHGLRVRTDARPAAAAVSCGPDVPHAIDHVVVQSPDLDRAIALWRDRLGVRLALDREFPQRGMRILFFRSAGVTLEFGGALAPASNAPDVYWGVAYQVADVAACRARVLAAGVQVSEVRAGHKRGTFVATAKSHTAGVPTLLIQPVAEPPPKG